MVPPITLCTNGHNICHKCRPQMDKYPTCRGTILNTRNVWRISRLQKYPCTNRQAGCNATFPADLMVRHEAECSYGSYKSPVTNIPGVHCPWKGVPKYLKNHIKEVHSEFLIEGNSIVCVSGTRAAVLFAMNESF
jgi:E3 ubiquitin-protein ligase SIAH1